MARLGVTPPGGDAAAPPAQSYEPARCALPPIGPTPFAADLRGSAARLGSSPLRGGVANVPKSAGKRNGARRVGGSAVTSRRE